eukprot:CAMPEP_0196582278 /NCGR_PEP_ID=MMETSP1081-20130531/38426_1 /TAXON_ID=36882 /ORGANISM="Pyramimonas amylifera, Strain CCMP720" /LENGTH=402 /DNA_ID=CAMNT_0041902801 /DNA_START=45 /DNA_END=1253 /DNA_ORIENTATION=+
MSGADLLEGGRTWIEEVISQKLPPNPMEQTLANGYVLERLARILDARYMQRSSTFKPLRFDQILRPLADKAKIARAHILVSQFSKFCKDFGMPASQLCTSSDVVHPNEVDSNRKVAMCLYLLWNMCHEKHIDYSGMHVEGKTTVSPLRRTHIEVTYTPPQRLYLSPNHKRAPPLPAKDNTSFNAIPYPRHILPSPATSRPHVRKSLPIASASSNRTTHFSHHLINPPLSPTRVPQETPSKFPRDSSGTKANQLSFAELSTPKMLLKSPYGFKTSRATSAPRRGSSSHRSARHKVLHEPLVILSYDSGENQSYPSQAPTPSVDTLIAPGIRYGSRPRSRRVSEPIPAPVMDPTSQAPAYTVPKTIDAKPKSDSKEGMRFSRLVVVALLVFGGAARLRSLSKEV